MSGIEKAALILSLLSGIANPVASLGSPTDTYTQNSQDTIVVGLTIPYSAALIGPLTPFLHLPTLATYLK